MRRRTSASLRIAVGLGLIGVATVVAVAIVGAPDRTVAPPGQIAHPTPTDVTTRTVLVSTDAIPPPSAPGASLRAYYMEGTLPSSPMTSTVLTDENCAPDDEGISHCTNRLELADGGELTVMHPHRMSEVPCLSPGEQVTVRAA
jgi:hypothetical protein